MCVICTTGAFMRGILLTNWGSHFVPGPTALFQVLLIAHSCNGMVRMNIYRNGKLLRTTEPFSGFRRYSPGSIDPHRPSSGSWSSTSAAASCASKLSTRTADPRMFASGPAQVPTNHPIPCCRKTPGTHTGLTAKSLICQFQCKGRSTNLHFSDPAVAEVLRPEGRVLYLQEEGECPLLGTHRQPGRQSL